MTTLYICAIRDSAIDSFLRPLFVNAPGQAIRSFTDEVQRADPTNDLNKHPSDFELYTLGQWDDQTGRFNVSDGPVLLVRGKDAVRPE